MLRFGKGDYFLAFRYSYWYMQDISASQAAVWSVEEPECYRL